MPFGSLAYCNTWSALWAGRARIYEDLKIRACWRRATPRRVFCTVAGPCMASQAIVAPGPSIAGFPCRAGHLVHSDFSPPPATVAGLLLTVTDFIIRSRSKTPMTRAQARTGAKTPFEGATVAPHHPQRIGAPASRLRRYPSGRILPGPCQGRTRHHPDRSDKSSRQGRVTGQLLGLRLPSLAVRQGRRRGHYERVEP